MAKNSRIFPKEDPRYGESFYIKGIQIETIDREFSEMMEMSLFDKRNNREFIFQVGKNRQEWRRNKQKISDLLCEDMNKNLSTPWKDVVAIEVQYIALPGRYIL